MSGTENTPAGRATVGRLTAGFVAAATAATIIGTAGAAGATPANKPSWDDCKKMRYTNYGQCTKDWAKAGHGYGGGHNDHHHHGFGYWWYKMWLRYLQKHHH